MSFIFVSWRMAGPRNCGLSSLWLYILQSIVSALAFEHPHDQFCIFVRDIADLGRSAGAHAWILNEVEQALAPGIINELVDSLWWMFDPRSLRLVRPSRVLGASSEYFGHAV